ncbi:MAG: hypothetical protein IIV91_05840, partial [Alistipes sp.]|nr:hypothetical protein [Alistipes sp.]
MRPKKIVFEMRAQQSKKSEVIVGIFCQTRKRVRSILDVCKELTYRRFGHATKKIVFEMRAQQSKKSEVIVGIFCQTRKRVRSILDVCEELAYRRFGEKFTNQNDFLILT